MSSTESENKYEDLSRQELLALARQQNKEMIAIKRIGLNLTRHLDLTDVLEIVAAEAIRLMPDANDINIFIYDGHGLGYGSAYTKSGKSTKPFSQPRPGGLTNTVISRREMIVVEDMKTHPLYADAPHSWRGAIVGIPLMVGEKVVGVLNLARRKPGPFSESELRLADVLANQAAIAIANANLHEEVRRHTRELEKTVTARTAELKETNNKLSAKLKELNMVRDKMIEQEKMASLGGLVSGVAHEINTPLGTSLTAISFVGNSLEELAEKYTAGEISRREFDTFIEQCREAAAASLSSLKRAVKLVTGFKMLSVDQEFIHLNRFDLHRYLSHLFISLAPQLKHRMISLNLDCPEKFVVRSYPGVFMHTITSLVMNSLIHGYEPDDEGSIIIIIRRDGEWMNLIYRDDGRGMQDQARKRIFEPFFTTSRGGGSTGLGMTVVYNMVIKKLGGSIEVESSPGRGMACTIRCPVELIRDPPSDQDGG